MSQDLEEKSVDDTPGKMNLEVSIESPSACQRHIKVTISREDIDRYLDDAYRDMMDGAEVPGFRKGHAPRKLVESRFRKDVTDQIKGSLLIDSMAQVNEDEDLTAISEPEIDVDNVEVPQDGPMTFEFDLEVRPDFTMPEWKGLKIEKPTAEFGDEDIDKNIKGVLSRMAKMVPFDGAAGVEDYVVVNVTGTCDGETLAEASELPVCVRPTVSFYDGNIEKFDKLMKGAKAGDKKSAKVTISDDAANEASRGKQVEVEFEVLEVKKLELPELTEELLKQMGNFESKADLRDAVKDNLTRRLDHEQQQAARGQVTKLLTEAADWELPPGLLARQSDRELERTVLELRRSGFGDDEIRAHVNELRQNTQESTAQSLREHFILEQIAEEKDIDAESEDYDREIMLIAMQSQESPRRVRAQLEKGGQMDSLRNQIIERKVIELVLAEAKFKEVPFEQDTGDVEAVALAIGGEADPNIPEAKHSEAESLPNPKDHT